jgi:hypothetical protein
MLPANTYVVRQATPSDDSVLERIAGLDGQRPLSGPVLLGEIDGKPAAAVSIDDGRVVADPFQLTAQLVLVITMRRRALLAYAKTPSLPARLQAQFRFAH